MWSDTIESDVISPELTGLNKPTEDPKHQFPENVLPARSQRIHALQTCLDYVSFYNLETHRIASLDKICRVIGIR